MIGNLAVEFIVIARRRARAINIFYKENWMMKLYHYIVEVIYL